MTDSAPRADAGPPFDPAGPLPAETTLLEASAGTGKTFAIAGLVARYVAEEGVPLHKMLVVTFGRAATSEMRERVRDKLGVALDHLRDGVASSDPYVRHLADASEDVCRDRVHRLQEALSDFDSAAIQTIHQFCSDVLAELGVSGGFDARESFSEDTADLLEEVIVEEYLRRVHADPSAAAVLPLADARTAARAAVADRHARLVPQDTDVSTAAARVAFAAAVRAELARRRRQRLEMDFDDLLARVADVLGESGLGDVVAQRLRARFDVVLVDEFQDTDLVQWGIFRTAFHGHVPLVLIGDPKQAIYAFRGGDLTTYLAAADHATRRHTLAVNFRADPGIVRGVHHLLGEAALGDRRITVHPVEAGLSKSRLPLPATVRLRRLTRAEDNKALLVESARTAVAVDVAGVLAQMLTHGEAYRGEDGPRALRPGDVAVLVRTNKQAAQVREHLSEIGVPAVVSGSTSIFATPAARDWVTVMQALEEPHRRGLVRAAAVTSLVGTSPQDLVDAAEDEQARLGQLLRRWQNAWFARGMPALLEQVIAAGLQERLLGRPDGERDLTDVRHVAEVVHDEAMARSLGPTAQREWLARQVADGGKGGEGNEERSRRLESDAAAVQVLTVHAAKGLEFPVVLAPYLWDRYEAGTPETLLLHGEDGSRLLDVGGKDALSYDEHRQRHLVEDADEALRVMYVALTRAASHLVLWWAPTTNTRTAPLHRIVFGPRRPGQVPPPRLAVDRDDTVARKLETLCEPAVLTVETVQATSPSAVVPTEQPNRLDGVARLDRGLDLSWRRTSFTGITANLGHDLAGLGVTSEPEDGGIQDEGTPADGALKSAGGVGVARPSAATADEERQRLAQILSPWRDLPAGAAFGTAVHEVLEQLDPSAEQLETEVRAICDQQAARRLGGSSDQAALTAALLTSLRSPLGPVGRDRRLLDFGRNDRLAEMDFELPLAGGDVGGRDRAVVADLAHAMREHLPTDDPLAPYPDLLAQEGLGNRSLGGYLVGSVDAVLRARVADEDPTFLVVDYKTNLVPRGEEPLSAWHYRPEALAPVMMAAHYPLQALLYTVAVHRYLRWRQAAYDPAIHLGGVLYLFLRGMLGPDAVDGAGRPCGVFSWRPPAPLVLAASDLLAGVGR